MKTAIMIAHAFPPEGNAGVYRPLRFIRHLPKLGWQPIVIAEDKSHYERYDLGLLTLVPHETKVIRVRSRDPWQYVQAWRGQRAQRELSNSSERAIAQIKAAQDSPLRSCLRAAVLAVEAWCYHPDKAMLWIPSAIKATVDVCARERPDVIWGTASPVSSFIVAQKASAHTGIPYLLDFRDPWTITCSEFEARRPAWATRLDRRILYKLLNGAQAVIFRYDTEAECFWRVYRGALHASRIHIIPNGYDGQAQNFSVPGGEKCTILYTGTLSSYRYDTLLQSLGRLKQSFPDQAKKLRFLFVGEGMDALAKESVELGLSDIVVTKAPTSYVEIARIQQEAHALLVLGRPPTIRGYELLAGAKLYNYLKTGLPIFGVVPFDETRKVLCDVGASTIADVNSPPEIVAVLQRLLDAWAAGTLSTLAPDQASCERYSAERQTVALVRALEGIPPVEPFVPGSVDVPPSLQEFIENNTFVE